MALPPRGDPQRPLALAIRSTRILGWLLFVLSLFPLFGLIYSMMESRDSAVVMAFALAGGAIVLGTMTIPGLLFLLCVKYMKRRRRWAIIVALVMSSIAAAMILLSSISLVANIATDPSNYNRMVILPVGIVFVLLAAMGQMIYHLSKSFTSLRVDPQLGDRGFTPILVQPVMVDPAITESKDSA